MRGETLPAAAPTRWGTKRPAEAGITAGEGESSAKRPLPLPIPAPMAEAGDDEDPMLPIPAPMAEAGDDEDPMVDDGLPGEAVSAEELAALIAAKKGVPELG